MDPFLVQSCQWKISCQCGREFSLSDREFLWEIATNHGCSVDEMTWMVLPD